MIHLIKKDIKMTIAEMIKELERYKNELGEDTKIAVLIRDEIGESDPEFSFDIMAENNEVYIFSAWF